MSELKRYMSDVYELGAKGYSCILKQHAEGEFVRYEDYARLKAEVERLTKAGDQLSADVLFVFGQNKDVDDWLAAKEGKPHA